MTIERVRRDRKLTSEEAARQKGIRERLQTERPTAAQLVAEDGYNEPVPHGEYLELKSAIAALKNAREDAGLTLTQVAEKSGMDKASLSRLETGRQINPTTATLSRYARAVGKRIHWTVEDSPPAPDHVTGPGGGGANPAAAAADSDLAAVLGAPPRAPKRRSPLVEAVRTAYLDVRGAELHSTDRVIADPDLDARFLERCRQLGAPGSDFELNWCLFNARKAKHLGDISPATRFIIPRGLLDNFLFASEIALRMLQDERLDGGQDLTLDKILCDPALAAEFDVRAKRLAPGYSPLQYRWAAIGLRKAAGRIRAEAEGAEVPKFDTLGPASRVALDKLPMSRGLYLIGATEEQPLFVGDTGNIRRRIELHLQNGEGNVLPDWVLAGRGLKELILGVRPMPDSDPHAVDVSELRAKMTLRPPLNFID
jgi:DNA-binding XRE family transcriptional regulator